MGRTFEVLGGRTRKEPIADAPAAIPFPQPDFESPLPTPDLVPITHDDLPDDDGSIPFIEVGGPRAKSENTPKLVAPIAANKESAPEVAFQLLPGDTRPAIGPPTQDLIAYHRPEHPAARQFRRLTDGIAAQFPSGSAAVLLFTAASSPIAGNAAANIAVTRANDGVGRVLVVEAERYNGSSARQFGVPEVPGLRELLARTVPLGLAIYRTGVDCVYCLPAGLARIGIDEASRLPSILDQLRSRFDWILVDAPPWGTHAMADWAKVSDGTYIVLKPDELDAPQVDAAHEGISRAGGKLRGCVIVR